MTMEIIEIQSHEGIIDMLLFLTHIIISVSYSISIIFVGKQNSVPLFRAFGVMTVYGSMEGKISSIFKKGGCIGVYPLQTIFHLRTHVLEHNGKS